MTSEGECSCLGKLTRLQEIVTEELHPCKEEIYESHISHLQSEIDKLQLRNDDLLGQLVDINSVITSDPFLSSKFQKSRVRLSDVASAPQGIDIKSSSIDDVYRQLCLLSNRNRELEGRLSSEQTVSMSWKHKVHDLEKKLHTQLNELIGLTKDVSCVKDTRYCDFKIEKNNALTKDAVNLLKLARLRIEGDKTKIESLSNRIAELERKLLEYRLNNTDSGNQGIDHIHLNAAFEPRQGLYPGQPLERDSLGETGLQDGVTSEKERMLSCLNLPKSGLENETLKYNGGTNITQEALAIPTLQHGNSHLSSERRNLIGLYTDILGLIKKNREPVTKPSDKVTHNSASKLNPTKQKEKKKSNNVSCETKASDATKVNDVIYKKKNIVLNQKDDKTSTSTSSDNSKQPKHLSHELQPLGHKRKKDKASKRKDEAILSPEVSEETPEDTIAKLKSNHSIVLSSPEIKGHCNITTEIIQEKSRELVLTDQDDSHSYAGSTTHVLNTKEPNLTRAETHTESDTVSVDMPSIEAEVDPALLSDRGSARSSNISETYQEDRRFSKSDISAAPSLQPNSSDYSEDSIARADGASEVLEDISLSSDLRLSVAEDKHDGLPLEESEHQKEEAIHTDRSDSSREHETPIADTIGSSSFREQALEDGFTPYHIGEKEPVLMENDILAKKSESDSISITPETGNDSEVAVSDYNESISDQDIAITQQHSMHNNSDAAMSEQKKQILNDLLMLLESVPIIKDLPQERLLQLIPYFKLQSYAPNAAIVIAGEKNHNFFVLASGMVSAYSYEGFDKPNRFIRRYLYADYFGEMSLMDNVPSSSYLIADGHVTVQSMSSNDFTEHLSDLFLKFRQHAMVQPACQTMSNTDIGKQSCMRAVDAFDDVLPFMSKVPILSKMNDLELFAKRLSYTSFSNKEVIADSVNGLKMFYIVYRGSISVCRNQLKCSKFSELAVLEPASFIGRFTYHNSNLQEQLDLASLVASSDGVLLKMDSSDFFEQMKGIINHLCDYMEQFFLDKLQENNLLQGMEEISSRSSKESERSSLINDSSSHSVASSDDTKERLAPSDAVISPLASSSISKRSSSCLSSDSDHHESDNDIRSEASAVVDSSVSQVDNNDTTMSSISSSFGDSIYSINSDSLGEDDTVSAGTAELSSFRSDAPTDSIEGVKETDSYGSMESYELSFNVENSDISEVKDDDATGSVTVFRKSRRAPTGIYKQPLKVLGNTSDEKPDLVMTRSSSWSDSVDLNTDDESNASNLSDDNSLSDCEDGFLGSDGSGSLSDDSSSVGYKVYDESTIMASKDLLIATLKSKCLSLAAAFSFMDPDKSEVVLRPRFYECMEELCIASIEEDELPYLFDLLKEPDRDVMTLASLYRNSDECIHSVADMHLRLKQVYGSALVAFEKHFGLLRKTTTCSESDFIIIANQLGVSEEETRSIFKELDVCGNGYVTVMTMLKLMRGEWSLDLSVEKETEAVSSYSQLMGYLQQDDYHEFRKQFSNPYMCVFDILGYGCNASLVDSSFEELKLPINKPKALKHYTDDVIIQAIEANEFFRNLSVIQRKFVTSLFTTCTYDNDTVIINEGELEYPIYLLLKGSVKSSYSTYIYSEFGVTDVPEGTWLALESFVQGQPSAYTYKAGDSALIGCIERNIFKETIIPMVEIRDKRTPVLFSFLKKVPCLEQTEPSDLERIARASVVRKYKIHETIYRAKDPADWIYIVFDGCVLVKLPGSTDQTGISLETTAMVGVEEMCKKMKRYQTSALANTALVYLIGWPVSEFNEIFGTAVECVCKASQLDTIERYTMRQKLQEKSLTEPPRKLKSVSFSMRKDGE